MMNRKTGLGLLAVGVLLGNAVVVTESLAAGVRESSTLWNRVAYITIGVVGDTCFVADPTDSSLNVRDRPKGRIVGQIRNGSEVVIKAIKKDRRGKAWAKIVQQGSESSSGYVILKYLQCP
jgi:Bacterial SH3 domain